VGERDPGDVVAGTQVNDLSGFVEKLRGQGADLPPRAPWRAIGFAALGGLIAIGVLSGLTTGLEQALLLGSFGASCVLVFGAPDVPFSQPRNVVAGHFISTLLGLVAVEVFGHHWWAPAIGVAGAIAAMMATRTVHPPAGSNPVIVYILRSGWKYLWFPTLIGAVILVAVALVYNNLTRPGRYPAYW
jgi:CBS-domain-containing membrane protein